MKHPRMWMECGVWPPPVRAQWRPARNEKRKRQRAFIVGMAMGAALGATIGSVMAVVFGVPLYPVVASSAAVANPVSLPSS